MRGSGIHRLLIVSLAAIIGACGGPATSNAPSPSPAAPSSPSASPVAALPTLEPSIEASPTVDPSPTKPPEVEFNGDDEFAFVNRFVMRVVVSDLNVREKPSTSAKSRGKAPKGGLFMFYDWPIEANGYTWYMGFTLLTSVPNVLPDLPTPIETGYDEVLGGWLATGTEDTPYLVPLAPRCPTTRDLLNVVGMTVFERVSCFGSDSLTLEGTYGCGGCGGEAPGIFEPSWLASPLEFYGLRVPDLGPDPAFEAGPLSIHFPPGASTLPAEGARIRVIGHFSDDRSTTCRLTVLASDGSLTRKIANSAAEQWCRGKFVVDSFAIIP